MNLGISEFGVRKPVVANLLMAALIIGGLVASTTLRKQFFPETDPDTATISLPYPGAAPEEVESSLAIKVEDALRGIDEVDEIRTTVAEGGGGITVKFKEGVDVDAAMEDVDREIDALQDLPEEAEEITTQLIEPRLPVIRVVLAGVEDDYAMKQAIRTVRDDLRSLPDMGEILIGGTRGYEINIDVDPVAMLEYGLSLPRISQTIRDWMTEIPGGTIKHNTGNVSLRTLGVEERAITIRQIPLLAREDGTIITVGEVATVTEGFVDSDLEARYDNQPATSLTIFKVGDQDIVHMAQMVRAYVDGRNGIPYELTIQEQVQQLATRRKSDGPSKSDIQEAWELGAQALKPLPEGASIHATTDLARFVEGRLDLLTRNAIYGAMLVFLTLLVFLNWRAAMWVGVGLSTAICGTLILMSAMDITLNLLTMFGLIVVLGLLVDDAIVVSENIQSHHDDSHETPTRSAINGANEVFWPVVATVLTSIVAFLPLTFIKGQIGTLLGALPVVVACALAMSLIESLLILPSHMGHSLEKRDKKRSNRFTRALKAYEDGRDRIMNERVIPAFGRMQAHLLHTRYFTLAIAIAVLVGSFGMVAGERLPFNFMPADDAESFVIDVRMPIGTPVHVTRDVVQRIEAVVLDERPEVKSIESLIGGSNDLETGTSNAPASHVAQVFVELEAVEKRSRTSPQITTAIRKKLQGKIDDVERISYMQQAGGPGGPDVTIRLTSESPEQLRLATGEVKKLLMEYDELFDVADDANLGQSERKIYVYPDAATLGMNNREINTQLRGFLFGLEAHTFAEREEDIDVRVRIDEETRGSLTQVQNAWLVDPQGRPVPMRELVEIEDSSTYASINRVDRKRAVTVTAAADADASPEQIVAELRQPPKDDDGKVLTDKDGNPLPSKLDLIEAKYPGLEIGFGGRQEQMADAFGSLPYGFMAALVMIYVILAWLFQSYFQPILVMCVVPFATIGLIWGHLLLGFDLTFLSLIGFVALSGIVVNDSLILVQFFNMKRGEGMPAYDALVAAGQARFRAIMLTTITTVLGLTPLILETSFQARFLIPMAISIAAGLISATVMILVVLPCIILAFDDLKGVLHLLWHGEKRDPQHKPEGTYAGSAKTA
ncbi:MAG: efflux RND transporter permease subunit [Phycisphaeraceae bacterium]